MSDCAPGTGSADGVGPAAISPVCLLLSEKSDWNTIDTAAT